MRFQKNGFAERELGQAMIETVLILWLVLLPMCLNALNLGYFFLVLLNLQAAPRTAVEYSIMGPSTPFGGAWPPATSSTTCPTCTVSHQAYQDMTGAMFAPTANGAVHVCSPSNGITSPGTTTARASCTVAGTTPTGYTFPSPVPDPELNAGSTAPAFILHRVDVTYVFNPLIPGTIFNLALAGFPRCGAGVQRSCCNANGSCIFHRYSQMRSM